MFDIKKRGPPPTRKGLSFSCDMAHELEVQRTMFAVLVSSYSALLLVERHASTVARIFFDGNLC